MQTVRAGNAVESAETFEGRNGTPVGTRNRCGAGADGFSVKQHGAGPALSESTTESRPVELEILLQNEQQGSRWVVNV